MDSRKVIGVALACALTFGTIGFPANALAVEETTPVQEEISLATSRATKSFNMTAPAKSKVLADSSFSMAAGETVTIQANYTPANASVDFGLVDSDGVFHYFNTKNGSIDKTMLIEKSGKYTFQVRNNSGSEVAISGLVRY